RSGSGCRVVPAMLDGWHQRRCRGKTYPVLERRRSGSVEGVVVEDVDAAAAARLEAYEGETYGVTLLPVRDYRGDNGTAFVFLIRRVAAARAPWSLAGGRRGRHLVALRDARAEMACRGRLAVALHLRRWRRRVRLHG